jgi:hypothetical protein
MRNPELQSRTGWSIGSLHRTAVSTRKCNGSAMLNRVDLTFDEELGISTLVAFVSGGSGVFIHLSTAGFANNQGRWSRVGGDRKGPQK